MTGILNSQHVSFYWWLVEFCVKKDFAVTSGLSRKEWHSGSAVSPVGGGIIVTIPILDSGLQCSTALTYYLEGSELR